MILVGEVKVIEEREGGSIEFIYVIQASQTIGLIGASMSDVSDWTF